MREVVEIGGDGTKWAAKLISIKGDTPERRQEHRESVLREAAMMHSLKHEGLLNLKEFFVEDELVVLILERMKGTTLLDYVLAGGGAARQRCLFLF